MPRCTSWDYKHLWLCLNHLVVCEVRRWGKTVIPMPVWCVCVGWQGVCAGIVPQVCVLLSPRWLLAAASHPTNFHARQDWTDTYPSWSHHLKDSLHTSCVCHWFSFTFRMIKLFYLTLWGSVGTTWTIWSWFKWGGLCTESQQLHGCFCRKAGVSSTGCALALDLCSGCKSAGDMEDPQFDSWDTELSLVSNLHAQEIHR